MGGQGNPIKVLYLITKSNWGGAQKYVYDLATHLPSDQFAVAVAMGGTGELYTRLNTQNIRTISLTTLKRDIGIIDEIQSVIGLFHTIRAERPDVLHLNSSKAGALGVVIGRTLGIKRIIFTAHGWAFNEDRPRWQKAIITCVYWLILMCAHETIAVSEKMKAQAPNVLGTRKHIVVIHNGVPPVIYISRDDARALLTNLNPRLKRRLEQSPDLCIVGTIAELHPIKGHLDAITAYATVRDTAPKSVFVILGEGEMRNKIEAHIKNLALEDAVFLLGHVSDAATYLQALDVFVLASHSEALSLAVLEAGLAGVPVIATAVGGIPEIITDDTKGVLVPARSTRELAHAIDGLLRDKERRDKLGKNLQETVREHFSLECMIKETTELYLHP